ncbi:MAG TPA: hypothetical protein VG106_15480, partial [Vicinamibacterales bacterium]|nr:hypothetical protein [Vicinamibacterales bacterium]
MRLTVAVVLLMLGAAAFASEAAAQSAHAQYTSTLGRERGLRDGGRKPTLKQLRSVVAAYERLVRRQPRSGYSDNALWQAANLSQLAFEQYGQASDKRVAVRLLRQLRTSYPSSSLAPRAAELLTRIEAPVAAALPRPVRPVVATAKVDLPPVTPPVPESESAAPREPRDPRR